MLFIGVFPQRIHTPEPIRPPRKAFHHPPVAEHMTLASGMGPDDIPRKIVGSRIHRNIPEFKESSMYMKQSMMKDAALFMGRSFRVGWGPGWTLVHSGCTLTKDVTGKSPWFW